MDSMAELKKLICAWAKLVCDKVSVLPRNPNRNTKPGWEIRIE